jgi:hypothetical protein
MWLGAETPIWKGLLLSAGFYETDGQAQGRQIAALGFNRWTSYQQISEMMTPATCAFALSGLY